MQGARQVRAGPHGGAALFVFIAPPSMKELEQRLRGRGTEAEEKVQLRLANACAEMEASQEPGLMQRVIVNRDLNAAVGELEAAVAAHLPELNIEVSVAPAEDGSSMGGTCAACLLDAHAHGAMHDASVHCSGL